MAELKIKSDFFDSWIWNKPRKFSEAEAGVYLMAYGYTSLRDLSKKWKWSAVKVRSFTNSFLGGKYKEKAKTDTEIRTDKPLTISEINKIFEQKVERELEQLNDDEKSAYSKYTKWVKSLTFVSKIRNQISPIEFVKANEKAKDSNQKLSDIILRIDNHKNGNKVCYQLYTSLYRTVLNFIDIAANGKRNERY